MFLRWSGVFSRARMPVSLDGMVQRGLSDRCVMMDMHRMEALSGVVVASMAGMTKIMQRFI
jgi:hypothetical protein